MTTLLITNDRHPMELKIVASMAKKMGTKHEWTNSQKRALKIETDFPMKYKEAIGSMTGCSVDIVL